MVLSRKPERQLIADALATGNLSVPDEHGFHHWIYAVCPNDAEHVQPKRTITAHGASGRHIDAIVFNCVSCGRTWQAATDELHLS